MAASNEVNLNESKVLPGFLFDLFILWIASTFFFFPSKFLMMMMRSNMKAFDGTVSFFGSGGH